MTCRFSFLNNSSEEPAWASPWDKRSLQRFSVRNTEFRKSNSRAFLPPRHLLIIFF